MSAEKLLTILNNNLNFNHEQNACCFFNSNIGLVDEGDKIRLVAYYNRRRSDLLYIDSYSEKEKSCSPGKLSVKSDACLQEVLFFDNNRFLIKQNGERCRLSITDELRNAEFKRLESGCLSISGLMPRNEARDPDEWFPVRITLKVRQGEIEEQGNQFDIKPVDNEVYAGVKIEILDITESDNIKFPEKSQDAETSITEWLSGFMSDFKFPENLTADELEVWCQAVYTLAANCMIQPGRLSHRKCIVPNRGLYASIYLWDSCFQNLALEGFNTELAQDALLIFCDTIRCDGKIPAFVCSTWDRPGGSQPPLLGWAAERLYKKTKDRDFAEAVFDTLEKNNSWWYANRMHKSGVIFCDSAFETGWDNTPRFDNGAVLPVDMNSYLLKQLKITSEFAAELGFTEKQKYWQEKAAGLEQAITGILYNTENNIFCDVDVESMRHLDILTPACFLPLWAGIKLPDNKGIQMIEKYLLCENLFYGDIPFPSVAYNDKDYDSASWWRGPVWPPIVWLMLEILDSYGMQKEFKESAQRFYSVMIKDKVLHELFNSKTGQGLGAYEQSWTAAVFLHIGRILKIERCRNVCNSKT
ncbi:MAG: amylo-alpha-1,6-glucosidase [Planctomycetota bacterium]|jgi:hypothetical protein